MATSASGRLAHECVGRRRWYQASQLARDHRDRHAIGVKSRDVAVPEHREVRLDELVLRGQVEPDLEQLERVRLLRFEEREPLRVDDALTGRQPLHVAAPEPCCGTERVGVVDEALADVGDRLEPPVRVVRKARHLAAVVHPPAVEALEVLAQVPPFQRHRGPRHVVARRVRVVMVHAEEERVGRRPLEPQRHRLQHRVSHAHRLRGGHNPTCGDSCASGNTCPPLRWLGVPGTSTGPLGDALRGLWPHLRSQTTSTVAVTSKSTYTGPAAGHVESEAWYCGDTPVNV